MILLVSGTQSEFAKVAACRVAGAAAGLPWLLTAAVPAALVIWALWQSGTIPPITTVKHLANILTTHLHPGDLPESTKSILRPRSLLLFRASSPHGSVSG
jgi:hypothetical protein